MLALAQELGHVEYRILRLCHGHPVARDDDHASRLEQQVRRLSCRDASHFACRRRARCRCRAFFGAEAAEDHAQERAVHRRAHDVAEDRAARTDERARDDQQIVRQHEARGGRRPPRVAVQHRNDDRHVGAADGHHEVNAEQRGQHGAAASGHSGGGTFGADKQDAKHDTCHDRREVEHVSCRQEQRLAANDALELPERDTEPVNVTAPTKHADERLDS